MKTIILILLTAITLNAQGIAYSNEIQFYEQKDTVLKIWDFIKSKNILSEFHMKDNTIKHIIGEDVSLYTITEVDSSTEIKTYTIISDTDNMYLMVTQPGALIFYYIDENNVYCASRFNIYYTKE